MKKNILTIAIITVFSLCSCNKEDQIDGQFKVVYFMKNEIDLLQRWEDSCDFIFTFQFDEDDSHEIHHFKVEGNVYFQNSFVEFISNSSEYYFLENNSYIQMGFSSPLISVDSTTFDVGIFPLKSDAQSKKYNVLKFTSKKLWLEYQNNDTTYEIHLEKI